MGNKCICLVRVSTLAQDIEQQTQVVRNEAIKDGYSEIILIEDHESAVKLSEEERNGLNKMKHYIEHDSEIDCVYVYEISRISRQAQMVFSIRDYLLNRKIQLIVLRPYFRMLNDDRTLSETSNIFFGIFASMSENEGYIRKARMRRGVEKAKAMGRHAGGHVPFGYTTDKEKHFMIDEDEAKTVRWIFESYVGGMSMRRIGRELVERGIFKSTFLTCVQNVNNIIHSEKYCGRENGKEAIITEELFDRAQAICKRNTLYTNKIETKRICKGLLFDRNSGFRLSVNSGWETYYSKRKSGVSVSFKAIEPVIWEYSVKKYKQLYKINSEQKAKRLVENIVNLNIKISTGQEKIEAKKQQLNKLEERIVLGRINDKLAEKLENEINAELKLLEDNILRWKNEEYDNQVKYSHLMNRSIGTEMPDGTMYYENIFNIEDFDADKMDIDERIALVKQVIDRVILDRPKRNLLNIEIHNKVDNKVEKMQIDTFRYKKTM